ncbi:hypothetical protein GCM10010448_28960 [Streptomyces glomeratus]|uniref:Uncharacterized protein n=1 Tax=Streptomyces glomeratus TaxID=284452 RepID=A0ABP6LHG9_9ACTN
MPRAQGVAVIRAGAATRCGYRAAGQTGQNQPAPGRQSAEKRGSHPENFDAVLLPSGRRAELLMFTWSDRMIGRPEWCD